MKDRLLRLYDCFLTHRRWLWSGLTMVLVPLIVLALTLRYNEDIMDLLQWLVSDPVGQRGLTDQPEIDPPLLQQT